MITILTLFVIIFTSCSEKPDSNNSIYTSKVVKNGYVEMGVSGENIYATWRGLYRYNKKTNEILSTCQNPECKGNCLLESPLLMISQIVDSRLYFSSKDSFTGVCSYSYMDLLTGNIKVLLTLSMLDSPESCAPFITDGMMYYSRRELRDGGDAKNPDDYQSYIFRMPSSGGNSEKICTLADYYDLLRFVYEGKIITTYKDKLYSTDIETRERSLIYDPEKYGYYGALNYMSMLDGKVYFMISSRESGERSVYKNIFYRYNYLISVDLKSGSAYRLLDKPISSFCLMDNAIYYSPFELRHMYIPEDYSTKPQNVSVFLASATLYACDIDGKNSRALFTNENVDFVEFYTVVEDCLYGWLWNYDQEAHGFSEIYYGRIDLKTGNVTPAIVVE